MSIALLVVPFILVALLEHSELAVNSFRDLISILEQCVPCQLEVFKIMGKYHVQLQSLIHFKLLMELQEIFPHFSNYSFYCGDVQGVAVHMSVQKIDVLQVLNKEKMIFRNISAQCLKVRELIFVVLEKFFDCWSIEISTTTRALDVVLFHELGQTWHCLCQDCEGLVDRSQKS